MQRLLKMAILQGMDQYLLTEGSLLQQFEWLPVSLVSCKFKRNKERKK